MKPNNHDALGFNTNTILRRISKFGKINQYAILPRSIFTLQFSVLLCIVFVVLFMSLSNMKDLVNEEAVQPSGAYLGSSSTQDTPPIFTEPPKLRPTLPLLVLACNRVEIKSVLDSLLEMSAELPNYSFPIMVSHGCRDQDTGNVIKQYRSKIQTIEFVDKQSERIKRAGVNAAYQSVAQHYRFALNHVFLTLNWSSVIVVEDDLKLAPDFLNYFAATLPFLESDPQLYCISAWNDNGRPDLIDKKRNDLIFKSDFFPGLGWLILRPLWLEIRHSWPDIYWDEYLRHPGVRKHRTCLRPEIPRAVTFGRYGVSRGQYFSEFLENMYLNREAFNFLGADLSYLREPEYTSNWLREVYGKSMSVQIEELNAHCEVMEEGEMPLRVTYSNQLEFSHIARILKIMPDWKSGVMRTAYLGVVRVHWCNYTVYVAPKTSWSDYEET